MVKTLQTKQQLDEEIKACGNKLLVIDFCASWCGPCKMIAPKFEQMSRKFPEVAFVKINVEDEQAADEFKIEGVPTFVFIKNGKELERHTGADEGGLQETILRLK